MADTTFGSLPTEMKCQVFDYLHPKERQKFRLVSKTWDTLINQVHGVTLIFHNRNWEVVFRCPAQSIHAIFRNFTYPILQGLEGKNFPSRFNSLSLQGQLVCYNMIPLLQVCCNLKTLEIGQINGTYPDLTPDEICLSNPSKLLPALKILKIIFNPMTESESLQYGKMLTSLSPFFGCGGSKSKLVYVELKYERGSPLFTAGMFEENWENENHNELKEDDLFINRLICSNSETMSELRVKKYNREGSYVKFFLMEQGRGRRPSNSVIQEFRQFNTEKFDWLEYLGTQTKMKTFTLDYEFSDWPSICNAMASNCKTLTDISFTNCQFQFYRRDLWPNYCFNGFNFFCLQTLKHLVFTSRNYFAQWNTWKGRWSELLNIHYLPSTIHVLILSLTIAFSNHEEFSAKTFENLKNLEIFEFTAFPWFRFGDKYAIYLISSRIRNIIEWLPKLKTFKLRNRKRPCSLRHPEPMKTISDYAIKWILTSNGINFKKIRVKKSDGCNFFQGNHTDYFVNISIEQKFRNNPATI